MSEPHPYRNLKIPSNAPIELKPSPGKGWGVFATRPIQKGTLILTDKALFVITKPGGQEDVTEDDVVLAISQLCPYQTRQLLCLMDNGTTPFEYIMEVWAQNQFTLTDIPTAIGRGPCYQPAAGGGGCSVRRGLFPLQSRFNHSCIPNARVPRTESTEDSVSSFAVKDIAAGEEITICYGGAIFQFYTRKERHEFLEFVCNCKACDITSDNNMAFQHLSDMRRRLLRGLTNYAAGADIPVPGVTYATRPPTIIIDLDLKRAAESRDIPLSARFIHGILYVVLLEDEGLLDEFMEERIYSSVVFPPDMFESESNARIAKRALEQDTWRGALGVAFELDGCSDPADRFVVEKLRRARECWMDGPKS